jgi:hypothetical protein
MKKLLLLTLATLPLFAAAQVPSYVPTNGLFGWWPFNGNANDESGNGNNGTVGSGIALTTDRFNFSNTAYDFDGNGNIALNALPTTGSQDFTITGWVRTGNTTVRKGIACWGQDTPWSSTYFFVTNTGYLNCGFAYNGGPQSSVFIADNTWHFVGVTCTNGLIQLYLDGVTTASPLQMSPNIAGNNKSLGANIDNSGPNNFVGSLDDIGIWNRALTAQEVSALYNGCSNSVTAQPANQSLITGNNAVFTTASSDPNATYQWQTDLGLGFQNLSNAGQYSGATNDTLTVTSVNAGNNNQAFRCIVSSGTCTDTTQAAYITITTGITEEKNSSFTVFPNPATNNITVTWKNADVKTLTLLDATGRAVRKYSVSGTQAQLSLEGLASGVYFLSAGNETNSMQKIVKL